MAIQIASRPASIDGCMQTWSEHDEIKVVRSEMETGMVKVRRRFTGSIWLIDASVTLEARLYDAFRDWFRVNCQGGVLPTRVKRPQDGKEVVVRFSAPPAYDWSIDPGAAAFRVSMTFEQMPEWATL
jgi:hypothetical protein